MYSLAKSASSPQTLYSLDDPNAVITQFMAYQNSLHFCVAKDFQSGLLYKLDFETGDLTELPLPSEKYVQYFMLQGSKMYFSLLSTSTAFETQSNMELWVCGTDLTQSQYVGLLNIGDLSCDEEYIYVTQASDIWIYDHEANLADELLLEEQFQSAPTFINLYVSNSDALFLWAKLPNTNAPSLYLGSKKDLGAAKFAFRHLNIPAD